MRYLLDTNIVVFLLRGRVEVAEAIDKVGFENCAISEVTKAEILTGYHKAVLKGRHPDRRVLDFLDAVAVVPVSSAIDLYSRELARLQVEGLAIDDFDLLIATTAVACGMVLVTDNVAHLGRVQGVMVENWVTFR